MGKKSIAIPERIAEEIERRGLDIEELVLKAISRALHLDPEEIIKVRIELAGRSLAEAEDYIAKEDPVQASKKLYKAAEECIKALAEKFKVQLETVEKRGKWDTWLLGQASRDLAERLGEEKLIHAWTNAYDIHVWGFHEAKYRTEDVRKSLPIIKWLLDYTRKTIETV